MEWTRHDLRGGAVKFVRGPLTGALYVYPHQVVLQLSAGNRELVEVTVMRHRLVDAGMSFRQRTIDGWPATWEDLTRDCRGLIEEEEIRWMEEHL